MCMVLYVAADKQLPLIPWEKESPAFNVRPLDKRGDPVRRQFSKPHVYYVGSHQGCGCGFSRDGWEESDSAEARAVRESLAGLAEYLREAIQVAGSVEVYACWDGDEASEPQRRITINWDSITGDPSWFDEKTFAVVR